MKITAVTQHYYQRYHFVKVQTDEDIYGFAEATLRVKQPAIAECVKLLASHIIGKDAFDLEWRFNKFFCYDRWRGGVIMNTALAAVETAILDAIGKKLDQPIYNLLGGRIRDTVQLYANGWSAGGDIGKLKETLGGLMGLGFKAFKWGPLPNPAYDSPWRDYPTKKMVDDGIKMVGLVREIVGPDIELLIELHGRLDYDHALRFCEGVAEFNPFFIEEPLFPDDLAGYRKLHEKTKIPLAQGERQFTRWGHKLLLEEGATRVVQPDFAHCAGLLEAQKMGTNSETFGVLIAPHNSNGPQSTMAAVHVDATLGNFYKQEYIVRNMEFDRVINKTPMTIKDGGVDLVSLPPGLGLTPDFDAFADDPGPQAMNDW